MKKTALFSATLMLLTAGPALAGSLEVLSTTPSGQLTERRDSLEVTVTFSQPMVPLAASEATGKFCPIELKPAVPGLCQWQGNSVLTYRTPRLAMATEYTARVPAGTASQVSGDALAEDYSWSFSTLRPGLVRSVPSEDDLWRQPGEDVFLQFNLDMEPRLARKGIRLFESRGGRREEEVSAGLRRAAPEEIKKLWPWAEGVKPSTSNVVALHPSRPMVRGAKYRVSVGEGVRSAEGTLGVEEEKSVSFETYFPFELLEPVEEQSFCLPDHVTLAFSNPVLFEDLIKNIRFEQEVEISSEALTWEHAWTGNRDAQNRRVKFPIWAALRPDTLYSLKISSGLKDEGGAPLGRAVAIPVRTQGYCPHLNMPTGLGVLESYLPPLQPVELLNAGPVPVHMYRIAEDRFVPFHKDWEKDSPAVAIPYTAKAEFEWKPEMPRNARMWQGLDLGRVLKDSPSGIVLVEVQFKDTWHKALVNVTKLGLSVKASPDVTFIETTFLRNASPVKGAQVEIRDDSNKVLWTSVSGPDGVVRAPGWKGLGIKEWPRYQAPRLWVFARLNQEVAVAATDWRGGISPWRFNIDYDSSPKPEHYRGALFTDRGVYRSGETVRVKGLVRRISQGDWVQAGLDKIWMTITDPRGGQAFRSTVPVSALSSFDLSFRVPDDAPTGFWRVRARAYPGGREPPAPKVVQVEPSGEEGEGGEEGGAEEPADSGNPLVDVGEGFRVEPYKPASFEVRVVPLKDDYVAGEKLEASVDGWYLFGAPMADGPAEWKLRLEPGRFYLPDREEFEFGPAWWEDYHERESRLLASGQGKLDDKGKLRVEAALDTNNAKEMSVAVLEASATSPERQRLSGRGSVRVHPASVYVGLKPLKYFVEKGQPLAAEVVVVSPDGKAVEGARVELKLTRRFWQSVQKTGVGGRLEWVSEKRETVVSTRTVVSAKDPVRVEDVPSETGQYLLEAEVLDQAGRRSAAGIGYYVTGKGEAWWSREDNDIIELVPEKKEYKPGETARIMVKSPYSGARAMVTVERESVISHYFTRLDGGADFITVPITDKHVPNVYVGVMLLQGRTKEKAFDDASGDDLGKPQLKVGYAALKVNPGGRKLTVSVETDKGEYRPRGTVKAKVLVQGADKAGLPAEVTLYAVDEGVLSLTGYATPDVFSGFYGPRALQVSTADNRLYVIGQRNFGHKGKPRGGGGGASLTGIDLRSLFVPTAYWSPSLRTDAQGRLEAEFELPDNLSRFRLMAVVHEGKRFGSGDSKFTVKKPLLIRPSLPRFARLGDAFKGGMVVHNYTAADAVVSFKTELKGDSVQCEGAGAAQEKPVPAGRAVEVLWDCKAVAQGKASFEFVARAGDETDGLRWEVPVILPVKLETVATSGAVSDKPAREKLAPPQAVPKVGGLEVGLSASALSGLQEGVRFLLEYPYGCLEQRISTIMPVLVGGDLVEAFGLGDISKLKAAAREVLVKMPAYQTPSGGFTYWLTGWREPDPYLTSYALHALALAKREGYYADQGMIDKAAAWLDRYVKGQDIKTAYPYTRQETLTSQAYAVYALALHGTREDAAVGQLFQARDQLMSEGKAHLLRAAAELKSDDMARQLAQDLLNRARVSPTTLYFDDGEAEAEAFAWIHASAARTTADSLQALLDARGGFAGDEKAVRWLMEERKIEGRWRTTQENSAALRALQDFYRRYEKDVPDFTAKVTLGEGQTETWTAPFKGRTLETVKRDFPMSVLAGKTTPVTLEKDGTGRLYYTLRMSYAPGEKAPPKDAGMSVTRSIKKLYGPGKDDELGAGSRAVVTLKVKTPKDRTFVALESPLPAGFEIVDPSFAVESQEDAHLLAEKAEKGEEWGGFQRTEKYDDRLVVFADYLPAGEHSYSFLVQATVAGRYTAPPAWVEQMYQPEVFGRGPSETLEIK